MTEPRISDDQAERGIPCRKCGCCHHRVIRTVRTFRGRIGRRRECRHCGYRFWTYERPAFEEQTSGTPSVPVVPSVPCE